MRIKKLLSLLLALILCVSLLPAALAEESVGVIAPAEEPDEENAGLIMPADPGITPEKTGWAVPLWNIPEADEINVTEHTIDVPDVNAEDLTDESVYNAMIAKKADFPEGMHWTNDDFYRWNGGIFYGGYGCAGFAFLLSDAAFGKLPARQTAVDYEALRVGDVLRVNNDSHSVIVTEIYDSYVVLAEGNYNSSIHWGRTMTRSQVEAADYVLTRWPGEPVDLDSCSLSVSVEPSVFCYEQEFDMIATLTDKDGQPLMGELVYFGIQNTQGSFVPTNPLDGYTYYGTRTDVSGRAVLPFTFHKADGRIQPDFYLVYAKLDGTSDGVTVSGTAPFTLLDNAVGTVVLSDAQARPGEEFILNVDLTSNPGVFALRFHVDYDSSLLRFLGAKDGSLTGWTFDAETGMLLWDSPNGADKTDTEGIVQLRFQVLENAGDCETTVGFDKVEAVNYAVEDLEFDVKSASVVISSVLAGDVNGDDGIDILDLVRMRKYLVNSSTPISSDNADLDKDGTVGLKDLVLLRKLLLEATN